MFRINKYKTIRIKKYENNIFHPQNYHTNLMKIIFHGTISFIIILSIMVYKNYTNLFISAEFN